VRPCRYSCNNAAWHGSPEPLPSLRRAIEALAETATMLGRDPAGIDLTTRAPLHFDTSKRAVQAAGEIPDFPTGTPDQVLASIHRYSAAGFSELVFDTFFGHPDLDDATPDSILRTLDLFARTVIPAFKG